MAYHKLMLWEFAASLEKNYHKMDVSPKTDKNGKRIYKSNYKHHVDSSSKKNQEDYLKKIDEKYEYDPSSHTGIFRQK